MNEYRKQQLRAAELIEQGATAEQIAAVYGWTKTRVEPEPIETGDKRTLTHRGKCGIIKAIKRHVNRWKQKQEGKTMKIRAYYYENNGYNGILLTYGKRFISYDERIDGIDVTRDNIPQIVRNFEENGLDSHDFETLWGTNLGTLIYGENAKQCLSEQEYTQLIYEK